MFVDKDLFFRKYPLITSPRVKWGLVWGASLFVLLFTSLFQPFYLSRYAFDTKVFVIISWTLITWGSLAFNLFVVPRIFPRLFVEKDWKVINEIFWINYNIFFVAFGCFLFKVIAGFYSFSLERIVYGFFATLAVGFIPVTIYVLVRQYIIAKQNLKSLEQKRHINILNDKMKVPSGKYEQGEVVIRSDRKEKQLLLNTQQLLYVEADKNYLNVYVRIEGETKVFRIRNRIINLLEQMRDYPGVMRSHRAFIVNLAQVREIKKTGSTHKLRLSDNSEVPVSKTYLSGILKEMERKSVS